MKRNKILAVTLLFAFALAAFTPMPAQAQKGSKIKKNRERAANLAEDLGLDNYIPFMKYLRKDRNRTKFGLAVGYNNFAPTSIDDAFPFTYAPSMTEDFIFDGGYAWNLKFKIMFYRGYNFSIQTGLGYESDVFRFHAEDNTFSLSEGKLVARYITVPLQLKYKFSNKFAVHAGVTGGIQVAPKYPLSLSSDTPDFRSVVECEEANLAPFKLDAQAGFTVYHVTFFVKQALLNTFDSDYPVNFKPLSVGVSLGL